MLDNCYHSFKISTMGRAVTSRNKIEKMYTTERTDHDMVNAHQSVSPWGKNISEDVAPVVFCYPDLWKS